MRRRTYRNILIVAILAILIAVGIAGISIYQKYRSQPVSNASQDVASEVIDEFLGRERIVRNQLLIDNLDGGRWKM